MIALCLCTKQQASQAVFSMIVVVQSVVVYRRELASCNTGNLATFTEEGDAMDSSLYDYFPVADQRPGCQHTMKYSPDCHQHTAQQMNLLISPRTMNPGRKKTTTLACKPTHCLIALFPSLPAEPRKSTVAGMRRGPQPTFTWRG